MPDDDVASVSDPILRYVPDSGDPADLWSAMMEYCAAVGVEPYDAQEEAFLAIAENQSVVLHTPTGSGKSLVALAAHFVAMCAERRSIYTAPTKALVHEKFFDLCGAFGPHNVGLMTGDAAVNREAPIMCCTAEILANMALVQGKETPFHWVIMDEFHYISDRDRGMAWLVPLLEMVQSRFLLMSATLHDAPAICRDLERRTGAEAVLVRSTTRPVPLEFEYRDCLLLESVEAIRRQRLAPAYIVSFTKKDAAALASQLRSTPVADEFKPEVRENRKRMTPLLNECNFDTPFGKKLETLLRAGIAVHHGGMLPKYRRLVERLTRENLISFICGTDTLGVGVNMPIRTVLFTQLYKFDGRQSRTLAAREFLQIAGRAGRKGHDDVGSVWIQAPEHEVRNVRKKAKASASNKKFHAESAPRGFKGWNESTMEKLKTRKLNPLVNRFEVVGLLVLQILARPGDGMSALRGLIRSVDEDVEENLARADEILASFITSGIVEDRTENPDEEGRPYVVVRQGEDVTFDRPLDPFLGAVLSTIDESAPDCTLAVLSYVEAVLENPRVILEAQRRKARDELYQQLRAEGGGGPVTIEMQEKLDAVEYPMPMREEIERIFAAWQAQHPFLSTHTPRPKSIVRDLFERGEEFNDYVRRLELIHDEGTLLRYVSDVYKLMSRNLPPRLLNTEDGEPGEIASLIAWLDDVIRRIDSSVVHEWEQFGTDKALVISDAQDDGPPLARDITQAKVAFRVKVRTAAFRFVQCLARHAYEDIATDTLTAEDIAIRMEPYWDAHEHIVEAGDARGPDLFEFDDTTGRVRQTILDPEDGRTWVIDADVDFDASREEGRAVVVMTGVGPATD